MLNFKLQGKITFEDYLTMYKRLMARKILIGYGVIYLLIALISIFITKNWLNFLIVSVIFIGLIFLNYKMLPKQIRRMYEQNAQLQQVQQFDFYKGMKFPQAIKKISYFDDAVYINFGKGQMIALPKNWLQKQEHWSAFQGFLKVELDPKAK